MAAKTKNLGLHQWEPGDQFLRTDFNEDFAKIDALAGQVKAKANCRIVTGSYTGTGTSGKEDPTVLTFDGPPLLIAMQGPVHTVVMVRGAEYATGYYYYSGYTLSVKWTGNQVSFYGANQHSAQAQFNSTDETYFYVALLAE